MKKFLTLLCMITCIFGLTACGSGEQLTEYEQQKVDYAQRLASEVIVPMLSQFEKDASFDEYTPEEVEYMIGSQYSLNLKGYGFTRAVSSFASAKEDMGAITGVGSTSASIDGNEIIVEVEVTGEKKNATAEVIFSNDSFMYLESAALNPSSGMGELMGVAALNTLIGMGTVFCVLILISLIISCFKFINKAQDNAAKKKAPAQEPSGVDNALAQIVEQEAAADETDDLELVAVIAAAIASSEGAVTTDGFVVRSIRRRR